MNEGSVYPPTSPMRWGEIAELRARADGLEATLEATCRRQAIAFAVQAAESNVDVVTIAKEIYDYLAGE